MQQHWAVVLEPTGCSRLLFPKYQVSRNSRDLQEGGDREEGDCSPPRETVNDLGTLSVNFIYAFAEQLIGFAYKYA